MKQYLKKQNKLKLWLFYNNQKGTLVRKTCAVHVCLVQNGRAPAVVVFVQKQ